MSSNNRNSLSYIEDAILHPTRSSRFYAARRLRLQNDYAYWAQIACALCLIFWSLRPAFGFRAVPQMDFYAAFASISILAMTLAQQAAGYIDQARSLEASARKVDALRRDIVAEVAAGNDASAIALKAVGRRYSKILEEFPVNHTPLDHRFRNPGLASSLVMHVRAGLMSILVTLLVFFFPISQLA